MIIEVRKLQKSKTGYYINVPKNIAKALELTGAEFVTMTLDKETNNLILDVFNPQDLNNKTK